MLDEGVYASVSEIGDAENISKSYVSRILRLALLAPDSVEAILVGSTDQVLLLERLARPLPVLGRSSALAFSSPRYRELDPWQGAVHLTVSSRPNRTDMTSRTWVRPATFFSTTVSF
jgi:hypothetical protein